MTIDEAIIFCNEKSENIKLKAEPQVFIEIAEMLEELKCYRNNNNFSEYADKLYKTAYNKAIDETCLKIFNHLLSEIEWNRVLVDDWDALAEEFKEIAKQMKAGE